MSRVINDVFTFYQLKLIMSFFSGRFVTTGAFNQTENHFKFPFFLSSVETGTEFRTSAIFVFVDIFAAKTSCNKSSTLTLSRRQETSSRFMSSHN